MKKFIFMIISLILVISCNPNINGFDSEYTGVSESGRQIYNPLNIDFKNIIKDEYIVKTLSEEKGFNKSDIERLGGTIKGSLPNFSEGYAYWLVNGNASFLRRLTNLETVVYIEPNCRVVGNADEYTAEKHELGLNYIRGINGNLDKDPVGDREEYALRVTKARNWIDEYGKLQDGAYKAVGYGTNEVVIAIIDTGINMNHVDFKDISGKSIILYAKSAFSQNISGGDFSPLSEGKLRTLRVPSNEDGGGHGTHCAGTMCAVGDNNAGISGVAWKNTRLISYKGLGLHAGSYWTIYGSLVDLADTVRILKKSPSSRTYDERRFVPDTVPTNYQITQKVVPVNMSLGSNGPTGSIVIETINYALANDVLPVIAMGNEGRTIVANPAFVQGVMSVGATTAKDEKANFSDSGNWIDISAPGHSIVSCYNGRWSTSGPATGSDTSGEQYMSGTSMATPFITGTIGYLLSFDNAHQMTAYQIKTLLEETADKIDSKNPFYGYDSNGYSTYYGHGRVNVLEAAKRVRNNRIPAKGSVYSEYKVILRVVRGSSGSSDMAVYLYDSNNSCVTVGVTDAKGYIVFNGLKAGERYTVKVKSRYQDVKTVRFTAPSNSDINETINIGN